jgi:curved DNA-binding protein
MFGGQGGGFSDFFETLFGGMGGGTGFDFRGGFSSSVPRGQPRPRRGQDIEHEVSITLQEAFHGTSRILQKSDGSKIEAQIPPGVRDGSRVRLKGQGSQGPAEGPAGDLYLKISITPHNKFQRQGDDLQVSKPVDLYTLILGGEVQVSSLDKTVNLTIPPETRNGTTFRLRGLGMPKTKRSSERGDLFVKAQAQLPQDLNSQEKELFEELQAVHQNKG